MVKFSNNVFCLLVATAWAPMPVLGHLRTYADRIRNPNEMDDEVTTKFFKSIEARPFVTTRDLQLQTEWLTKIDSDMSMALSTAPSVAQSAAPIGATSGQPSVSPSTSSAPTNFTPAPASGNLTQGPSASPTDSLSSPCGMPSEQRTTEILDLLDSVADPADIRDTTTPQGRATSWLLVQDEAQLCPDNPKILQRWVLAVMYFSLNGDLWFKCSANPAAVDDCGSSEPFLGEERFLSASNECEWAGLSCINACITEVEFEENNLRGTIPTEIALLTDLSIWAMERGGIVSTIPTEIGRLSNLVFLDLDFNLLTGSLTSELLSLKNLTQLDLNNNLMTGSINGIGVFPDMEFLQLHSNFFTGTVPEAVGDFINLAAFTLHATGITGSMPESVCDLLQTEDNGGVLVSLIADCDMDCDCCTDCRNR